MAAVSRKPDPHRLPVLRGPLRLAGETLEGVVETDLFDVVVGPGGDVSFALLDVRTKHGEPSRIGQILLSKAMLGLRERTPLHAMMLDLVRALLACPGTSLGVTLVRCSAADARTEVATAGMPPPAYVHPGGPIAMHSAPAPELTSTTAVPPPVEIVPFVWGSTWLAVSDGLTAGSDHPGLVRRLAVDLELAANGLALSASSPQALREMLAGRVPESGRFAPDDATLILVGSNPNARSSSSLRISG